jgi:WD40 repeat protein
MEDRIIDYLKKNPEKADMVMKEIIHQAVFHNSAGLMDYFFSRNNMLLINHRDSLGQTPLLYAIFVGNIPLAKKLIENGADLDIPDFVGNTPLSLARYREYKNLVDLLIQKKAKDQAIKFKPEIIIPTGHSESIVYHIEFSGDGRFVLCTEANGGLILWELATERQLMSQKQHLSRLEKEVVFSSNGKYIIAATDIYDISTGRLIMGMDTIGQYNFPEEKYGAIKPIENKIEDNVLNFNSKSDSLIYFQRLNYIKQRQTFTWKGWGKTFEISQDKRHALLVNRNYSAELWEIKDSVLLQTFDSISSVAFGPDDKYILLGGANSQVLAYDTHSRKHINTYKSNKNSEGVVLTGYTPDKKFIYATYYGDPEIWFWNATTAREYKVLRPKNQHIGDFAIGSDGKQIVMSSKNDIRIWNFGTDRRLYSFKAHDEWIIDVDISYDNKEILTASNDHLIKVWDINTTANTHTFEGYIGGTRDVLFSPDGRYIFAVSGKKNVMLYDKLVKKELTDPDYFKKVYGQIQGHYPAISAITIESKEINTNKVVTTLNLVRNDSTTYKAELWKHPDYIKVDENRYLLNNRVEIKNATIEDIKKKRNTLIDWESYSETNFFEENDTYKFKLQYNYIQLIDKQTNKMANAIWLNNERQNMLLSHPNQQFIISNSFSNVLHFWDIKQGAEIAKVIFLSDTEWLIACPDNYYTCSQGAADKISFKYGPSIYNFEQFDLKYNRPDIVLARLGLLDQSQIEMYRKAYEKRLQKMGFNEKMLLDEYHVPKIQIVNHDEIPEKTDAVSIKFKYAASETIFDLNRLNVWVNDVPVYGRKGIPLNEIKTKEYASEIDINLSTGMNKIQFSVLNSNGSESLKETFYIERTVKPANDLYIIAIGVSEFVNQQLNLNYAAKDARDFVNTFMARKNVFENIHVLPIYNQKALRENIVSAREILMKSKVDDMVMVFVASHGFLDDEYEYYIATHDIDLSNLKEKSINFKELEGILDGIPARKKIMFVDACHSGEADIETGHEEDDLPLEFNIIVNTTSRNVFTSESKLSFSNSFEMMRELFADLRRGTGAIIISSAGANEYAYEGGNWQNGLFTYCVLDGLKSNKADLDKDGIIQVSELQQYVSERVKRMTRGMQNPTSRSVNLEMDFKIW